MKAAISNSTILLSILVVTVLVSAVAAVYARHESRRLFVELQSLINDRDRLNIDWGRLQIEQSTWASPGRVEQMARSRLRMSVPDPARVVIVQP
ncbi:MAG: cell division protein FtsL [Gammaproteobacteria bacterium]